MARKEEHEKEPNHERWLVSYGDLLTLFFAVFVTLYVDVFILSPSMTSEPQRSAHLQ